MDIGRVRAFFFKGMMEGWAAGEKAVAVPDLPGHKEFTFRDGKFALKDRYCVNHATSKSSGVTTIWYDDDPVWIMTYGGHYDENAMTFLKCALYAAYSKHRFCGGRGPLIFNESGFVYVNRPKLNEFERFEGREEAFSLEGSVSVGYHEYWGMCLL